MSVFRNMLPLLLFWPLVVAAEPVNINTADAPTLARELVGVGDAKAAAIVAHRREHGPFRSVDELALVKGIGPGIVERNRANLRVGPSAPLPARAGEGRGAIKPAAASAPVPASPSTVPRTATPAVR